MIRKIPLKVFQACSIILFINYLGLAPIHRFVKTNDVLFFVHGFLMLILNIFIFLGYYKLSIENYILSLKISSLLLALTIFLIFILKNILLSVFDISEIKSHPILSVPNFIYGAVIVYFSITLFRIKTLNNHEIKTFALISFITGILYLSYIFSKYTYFANYFFYGALCRYLFPNKNKINLVNKPIEIEIKTQKYSRLGIASFIISIISAVFTSLLLVIGVWMERTAPNEMDWNSDKTFIIGFSFSVFLGLSFVALGLGIGGLIQKKQAKIFAIMGTIFSAILLISTTLIIIS
jgi:hypothetical protein